MKIGILNCGVGYEEELQKFFIERQHRAKILSSQGLFINILFIFIYFIIYFIFRVIGCVTKIISSFSKVR